MEVDSAKLTKPNKQEKFGDFGSMSSLLDGMAQKIEKQHKHAERVKQHEKQRANRDTALDLEKQRLVQIASLNAFQQPSALD